MCPFWVRIGRSGVDVEERFVAKRDTRQYKKHTGQGIAYLGS